MVDIHQMPTWLYAFVRTDIPVIHQAVQLGHAVYEASCDERHPSFVFLAVDNEEQLQKAMSRAFYNGIDIYPFYESYLDWGLTAFAINGITKENRHLFKEYKLWKV